MISLEYGETIGLTSGAEDGGTGEGFCSSPMKDFTHSRPLPRQSCARLTTHHHFSAPHRSAARGRNNPGRKPTTFGRSIGPVLHYIFAGLMALSSQGYLKVFLEEYAASYKVLSSSRPRTPRLSRTYWRKIVYKSLTCFNRDSDVT